ncbi:MAG TPA: hypothetical protein VGM30_04310 [Puia sp.]
MPSEYQEYYHQLLAAIASHRVTGSTEMEQVEACFKSSLEYWGKVRQRVKERSFATPEEEIHFFKVIKPLFASRIEYYTWCYHTLLFMPAGDLVELNVSGNGNCGRSSGSMRATRNSATTSAMAPAIRTPNILYVLPIPLPGQNSPWA